MTFGRVTITVVFYFLLMFSSPITINSAFNLPDSEFAPQVTPDSHLSYSILQKSNHKDALELPPPNTPLVLKNISITEFSSGHGLISCQDGGYAFLSTDSQDIVLVRLDSEGTVLWNQTYSSNLHMWSDLLVECQDGGFAMFCILGVCCTYDLCFIKTDANGNQLWNRTYLSPNENYPLDLVETSDGGFGLLMEFSASYPPVNPYWFVRTDADGIMLWNYSYPGYASSLVACKDGTFAIAGITTESSVTTLSLSLIDTNGSHLWTKRYYGPEIPEYNWPDIIECSNGGFAICGNAHMIGYDWRHFGLMRVNASGGLLWSSHYYQKGIQYFSSFAEASDGGFILFGESRNYSTNIGNAFLLRINPQGSPLWNFSWGFGEHYNIVSESVILCPDGTYVTLSYHYEAQMMWLTQFLDPLPDFVYNIPHFFQFWLMLSLGLAVAVLSVYGISLFIKHFKGKRMLSSLSKERFRLLAFNP